MIQIVDTMRWVFAIILITAVCGVFSYGLWKILGPILIAAIKTLLCQIIDLVFSVYFPKTYEELKKQANKQEDL